MARLPLLQFISIKKFLAAFGKSTNETVKRVLSCDLISKIGSLSHRPDFNWSSIQLAGPTRLELATSGVTGRRSNQLNYGPASKTFHTWRIKSRRTGPGPILVGGTGFEPVTAGV